MSNDEKRATRYPIEQLQEIDRRLPNAPWGLGEVSASQADIVDGGGNWIATVRKDFDGDSEDGKPPIVELRNMLPALLKTLAQINKEWRDKWSKTADDTMAVRVEVARLHISLQTAERKLAELRMIDAASCRDVTRCAEKCVRLRGELEHSQVEANAQRIRADAAEAMLAGKRVWQFEQPTPGRWRMKFLRGCGYEIMECEVTPFQTESSNLIVILPGQFKNSSLPINDEFFINAQWQRVE